MQVNNVNKAVKYNLDFETFIAALDVDQDMQDCIRAWLNGQYNSFSRGIVLLPEKGFKRLLEVALQSFNDNPALSNRPRSGNEPIDMWTWLSDVDNGRL